MNTDRNLTEQQQDSTDNIHAAGITIQLKNSRIAKTSVAPESLN